MQRKTTIPGKKSESFDVEQLPWSLIGIVPQGRPDRGLSRANRRAHIIWRSTVWVLIMRLRDSSRSVQKHGCGRLAPDCHFFSASDGPA
jgi:hypothetical protein